MKIDDYYTLYTGESLKKRLAVIIASFLILLAYEFNLFFGGESSLRMSFGTFYVAFLYYYTPRYFSGAFQMTVKKPYRMIEKNYLINFFIFVSFCFLNTIIFNTVLIALGKESIQPFVFELALDLLFCSLIPLFYFIENQALSSLLLLIIVIIRFVLTGLTLLNVKIYVSLILAGLGLIILPLTNILWIKEIHRAEKSFL